MLSSEQILEQAARDGSIDIAEWPRVLETVLQRLRDIVYNDFPIPSIPTPAPIAAPIDPEVVASTPPRLPVGESETHESITPGTGDEHETPADSQNSTKENEAPKDMAAGRPPSLSAYPPGYELSQSQQTEEMPPLLAEGTDAHNDVLPPDLLSSYQYTERMLKYEFGESPPYTIQRLAELVLHPRKHYRFLPPYLRALDRIVAVSSPVSDFPLPTLHASANGGFLTNGEAQMNGISEREGLGSDESLGGALLTPIPWLRNQSAVLTGTPTSASGTDGELRSESTERIDGPHGAGSIETVSVTVNGVSSTDTPPRSAQDQEQVTTLPEPDADVASTTLSTDAQLREQGGLTQGELLRKEQEAGIVPVDDQGRPMTSSRSLLSAGAVAVGREAPSQSAHGPDSMIDDGSEDHPHARGPELIGMEDMGPQSHPVGHGAGMLDMEAAVGRGRSKSPQPPTAAAEASSVNKERDDDVIGTAGEQGESGDVETKVETLKTVMDREGQDADGDVSLQDATDEPATEEKK